MSETHESWYPPRRALGGDPTDSEVDSDGRPVDDPAIDVDLQSIADGIALLDELDSVLGDMESGLRRRQDTDGEH